MCGYNLVGHIPSWGSSSLHGVVICSGLPREVVKGRAGAHDGWNSVLHKGHGLNFPVGQSEALPILELSQEAILNESQNNQLYSSVQNLESHLSNKDNCRQAKC